MSWFRNLFGKRKGSRDKRLYSLSDRLQQLAELGLVAKPKFTEEYLSGIYSLDEEEGVSLLTALSLLGMTTEDATYEQHSEQVYEFDTECINGDGDYAEIVNGFVSISGGALRIENLRDSVDLLAGRATVNFEWEGRAVQIDMKQDDDWISDTVIECVVAMLNQTQSGKIIAYIETGDQMALFICAEPSTALKLKAMGLNISIETDRFPIPGVSIS